MKGILFGLAFLISVFVHANNRSEPDWIVVISSDGVDIIDDRDRDYVEVLIVYDDGSWERYIGGDC